VLLIDGLITHTHNKTFNAITDLEPKYENDVFKNLTVIFEKNISYSNINDSDYSNECLYNYFISDTKCPITDIIIENGKNEKYKNKNYNEIKINNNKYLYYTRNKKDGKLYKYTHDIKYENDLSFLSYFDFNTAYKIKIVDEDKSNNLFTSFKNIIYYGDLIIIVVISYYVCEIYKESIGNRIFNFTKILNMIYELGILIFYIIRYSEFVKFKIFLYAKEDIYKDKGIYDNEDNYYFPNKVFNLDSFPAAISLNILIIRLIYIIIPKEWHIFLKKYNTEINYIETKEEFCNECFFYIRTIIYFYFLISLSIYESNSFGYYDNLMYNWNANPIKSIELSSKKDYEFARIKTKNKEYKFYKWRDNYFKIEKLKKFNYVNIYKNENGKICGKDNYGNDLYFPKDAECPINDIIIDNSNKNYIDYKEIKLAGSKSLYYINKKISNKILIDLKANPEYYNLNLNLKKVNVLCKYLEKYVDELVDKCKIYSYYDINSYIIIDNWNYNSFLLDTLPSNKIINGELSLLGITYFGFDPSTIKERKKIQTIKSNLLAFKSFYILILILSVLTTFFGYFVFKFIEFHSSFIIFLILILFHIIMYLILLIVRINNIHNFIFKIIYKDGEEEYAYKAIICFYIINIITLSSVFILFLYLKIKKHFKFEGILIIEMKRGIDNNPTTNNNKNNDTINTERYNIIEYINHDSNNKRNKNKQKEEMKSSQPLIINKINKINNDISKPKVTIEYPNQLNINKENDFENNKIKFTERIECTLNTININKKNEISNDINEPKEITEYPNLLNINKKNNIEDDKSKLQIAEKHLEHLCAICYKNPIQVILSPCGHRCLCSECYKREKDNLEKCPICNKEIKSIDL